MDNPQHLLDDSCLAAQVPVFPDMDGQILHRTVPENPRVHECKGVMHSLSCLSHPGCCQVGPKMGKAGVSAVRPFANAPSKCNCLLEDLVMAVPDWKKPGTSPLEVASSNSFLSQSIFKESACSTSGLTSRFGTITGFCHSLGKRKELLSKSAKSHGSCQRHDNGIFDFAGRIRKKCQPELLVKFCRLYNFISDC